MFGLLIMKPLEGLAAPGLSDFSRSVLQFPIVALGENIPTEPAAKTINTVSKRNDIICRFSADKGHFSQGLRGTAWEDPLSAVRAGCLEGSVRREVYGEGARGQAQHKEPRGGLGPPCLPANQSQEV